MSISFLASMLKQWLIVDIRGKLRYLAVYFSRPHPFPKASFFRKIILRRQRLPAMREASKCWCGHRSPSAAVGEVFDVHQFQIMDVHIHHELRHAQGVNREKIRGRIYIYVFY